MCVWAGCRDCDDDDDDDDDDGGGGYDDGDDGDDGDDDDDSTTPPSKCPLSPCIACWCRLRGKRHVQLCLYG